MGLSIRLKGYVYRQHRSYTHHWIGEWFYYNFAAGSFHTKKLRSRLYSISLEFFGNCYGLDVRSRYWLKSELFSGGWANLSTNIRCKGTSPTNLRWYQKTRMITLSCGIKISAVDSIVSSQSTRVTDRQADRITIPRPR